MNVQETTDMIARLMKDEGLIPTTQGRYVTATIEPLRRLKVQVYDCFSGSYHTLNYVDRIVIRADGIGGRTYARTFKANRKKDHTFNEAGILRGLRMLAQGIRDDVGHRRISDKRAADIEAARLELREAVSDIGVDMNPAGRYDRFDGQAETRFGNVDVRVTGAETIQVLLPEFKTAEQVAEFLELIR